MKKRLFSIITILGIGCSFCSADNSCSFNTDNFTSSTLSSIRNPVGVGLKFLNDGEYSISSLSLYCGPSRCPKINDVQLCFFSGVYNNSFWGFDSNNYNCITGLSYTIEDHIQYSPTLSGYRNIIFSTPLEFSTIGSPYIVFIFPGSQDYINYWQGSYDNFVEKNIGSSDFVFYNVFDQGQYYVPREICYSMGGTPKFKVNYGNTSYEYELDSDLSIYLKSPVIQNGNTFTYAGSTGLNLFYNNTSQRYNKSNLYLDSMFWYNKNIFTPICL